MGDGGWGVGSGRDRATTGKRPIWQPWFDHKEMIEWARTGTAHRHGSLIDDTRRWTWMGRSNNYGSAHELLTSILVVLVGISLALDPFARLLRQTGIVWDSVSSVQ